MPPEKHQHAVILFDGVCNLCNRTVQTIIKHDPSGYFRFAALQSDAASKLLTKAGFDNGFTAQPNSVVLIEDNSVFTKSEAVIRILSHLKGMSFASFFYKLMPARLRESLYDYIAKKRYRWFGRREKCMIPSPDLSERFL
jgi:predicted DCC family thiol-disulfide oxidoreductase YuxK